jgi:hypothetical protein
MAPFVVLDGRYLSEADSHLIRQGHHVALVDGEAPYGQSDRAFVMDNGISLDLD